MSLDAFKEILKDSRGAYANHRERELESTLDRAISEIERLNSHILKAAEDLTSPMAEDPTHGAQRALKQLKKAFSAVSTVKE